MSIYIDKETIKYGDFNNSYRIYQKLVDLIDYSYTIELCVYYCDSRIIHILEGNKFNEYGNFMFDYEVDQKHNILPESNWEKVYNYLCK